MPIAVAPFPGEGALGPGITSIVLADLERSGLFRGLEVPPLSPAPTRRPGQLCGMAARGWPMRWCSLGGRPARRPLRKCGFASTTCEAGLARRHRLQLEQGAGARHAHRIADFVYEKLTGEKGVFLHAHRLRGKRGNRFELQIATPTAQARKRARLVDRSFAGWSPDGRKLAYVSFENKKPVCMSTRCSTGSAASSPTSGDRTRRPPGRPDGAGSPSRLSREGGSQIFLLNADGSSLRRLTSSAAIDTGAALLGDGQWIYFTSDRGAGPQIYRMPAAGGEPQRVTFEGSY